MDASTKHNNDIKKRVIDLITNSNGRSHSFILSGAKGTGKSNTTKYLTQELLQTHNLSTHPNILWINTNQKTINVAAIRNISNFMYKTTYHTSLPKLIVIDYVDNLNIYSLNALLKIIEEPTKNTYFILISHNIETLPDTIKSRCVIIKFTPLNLSTTRHIIKQKFPDLPDSQLSKYLSIASTPGTITELINNNALGIYQQLLKFLQATNKSCTQLYKFIEKNFSTPKQLEIFQILIKNLILKVLKTKALSPTSIISAEKEIVQTMVTKNLPLLLSIDLEIDSFAHNSKTLGLDIKTVVLVMVNKIKTLTV